MIDLSFLTEEEQEIILAVLRRDAELKKAEEQRIQNLQKSLSDKGQLRYLTGEWFYETKQLRHQDRIHGSDIIRASMKHTNKPLTIMELSQILPERSSFVSSDNKEVFVPPVLRGLLQEPHSKLSTEQYQNQDPYETQDTPPTVLQSSTKRKNPFNSEFYASHNFEEKVSQQDGATDETQKPTKRVWELLIPAVPNLVPEQESGKPAHLETRPEEDYHSRVTDGQTSHSIHQQKLPEESTIVEAPSDTQPSTSSSTKSSSYAVSPQPKQRMFGIFKREKLKSGEVQGLQRDVANMQHNKPGNTQNLSQDAADMSLDKHEDKPFQKVEVKTLQLAALQNTTFTESVTTVDVDTERDETKGRVFQSLERLSSLKSFWKREITGPKIIYPREESKQEDLSEKAIEISHLSTQNEMTVDETAGISPQTGHSFSVDSSREDGTYRANPVLIYEETDESLTGSVTEVQISESQEIIITPVMKQQESVKVPISRQSSLSPQDDRTAKIGDLKHFSETEYTEPRIVSASVKESSSNLALCNKVVSPQSDLKRLREKSEEKAQTSPSETGVVSKSLKVTDKGFVSLSPDWTQLKSSHGTEDTPTCHSQQFKDDTKSQERPLIPSKPPKPGSKDQDEEVRRSPSKTCHPRVLPRESFSPKRSSLEGSPLKTFPIDIDWQIKAVEEQKLKPTPLPRQRKNISHAATPTVSTDTESSSDITTCPLSSHHEDREANFDYVHCPQSNSCPPTFTAQLNKASEKKLGTFTHLARSVITQDFQHYLGPQEKAYIAPFDQEKGVAAESDVTNRTQSAPRDFAANHSDSPTKGNPRIRTVQTKAGNSSQDTTTGAWLLSRASSGSYEENSCPIMSPVEGSSSQTMSSSKSLENLTSQTTSTPPNLQQVKSSVSVPVLQQDEMDSDSTFETNLGWRRNTGSSTSNLSLSSGMASMSSVSGSISSIYPTDSGDIEVQGNIQLAVNYIQKLGEFHIFVVHCRDLAVADMKKNRSDPYVKCYLVPDKTKLGKKKTTIKKKTLNPTYNEILRFKITMEALKCQNMRVSVWHSNTFGRNSFLGEVDLDLTEWDFSNTHINEYALKARVPTQPSLSSPLCPVDSRGEMRVALRFLPQTSHSKRTSRMETGEVQIWVKDCKNLPSVRGVTIDPFVKCTVLPDSSKKSRQKTRVVKRTANPMFNHTMVYDGFRSEDLREACVEITVWDHDRLNSHYIGGLRLGLGTGKSYGVGVVWMDSTTAEANLWQRMLRSDGEWVEDVLPLRMFSVAKNTT